MCRDCEKAGSSVVQGRLSIHPIKRFHVTSDMLMEHNGKHLVKVLALSAYARRVWLAIAKFHTSKIHKILNPQKCTCNYIIVTLRYIYCILFSNSTLPIVRNREDCAVVQEWPSYWRRDLGGHHLL